MTDAQNPYASADEVETVVRGFEACTTKPSEFTHGAHLTVALWYLSGLTLAEATERMRAGLLRFLNHYGEQGYNETITIFWLRLAQRFLDDAPRESPIHELANLLMATRNNSRLVYDYYSKELLSSTEAKAQWVEPDLRPLDF
jgi:hypothetical protein